MVIIGAGALDESRELFPNIPKMELDSSAGGTRVYVGAAGATAPPPELYTTEGAYVGGSSLAQATVPSSNTTNIIPRIAFFIISS
jgi:hypothetical protein